jgi:hypothetical protein
MSTPVLSAPAIYFAQPDATIFGMSLYTANRHVIQAISAEYQQVSNVGGGWKFMQISHNEMGVSCI